LTLKKENIQALYEKIINQTKQHIKIDGFRPGKAPNEVVEKKIDLSKVYEEIIQQLLPQQYGKLIDEYKIKPILQPKVLLENPPLNTTKDWNFKVLSCQKPIIKLKNYQEELKKINKRYKKGDNKQLHTQAILNLLEKHSQLKLPQILIDTETEHRLSQLVNNVSKAELSLDQYFKNNNSSLEKYKKDIKEDLHKKWKIDLALDYIATKNKIKADKESIDKTVVSTPNGQQRRIFIEYVLTQQKTIEFLQSHNI
jgi:FKBP-type peptidyl-prolyl cis-trans isomerase (trigger factor)